MNFSDPKTNLLQMGLREGMRVGDLGTGSGHYAIVAAGVVGNEGRVYAIDIQEDVLKHALDSAHRMGLRNIESVWGNIEKPKGTKLRDHTLDAAILSNALFQIEDKEVLVTEIKRILKPGGRLLVIDWAGSYGGMGPIGSHVVSEHAAEELFIKGGFHKLKDFRGGAHHYAIVFVSPAV